MRICYQKQGHNSQDATDGHRQSPSCISNSSPTLTTATMTLYSADGLTAIQKEAPIGESGFPLLLGNDDLTPLSWLQGSNFFEDSSRSSSNHSSTSAIELQCSSPEIDVSTMDAAAAILSLKHGSSTASIKELMEGNNHLRSSVIHSTSSQAPITISPYNAYSSTLTRVTVDDNIKKGELEKEITLHDPEDEGEKYVKNNHIYEFPSATKSVEQSSLYLYEHSNCEEYTVVDYNPKIHVKHRPPYSVSYVIYMAINESPMKRLYVREIYEWISINFPYFQKYRTNNWKNTVRQNLTSTKYFKKVHNTNLGKGSLWTIVARYVSRIEKGIEKIKTNDRLMKLTIETESEMKDDLMLKDDNNQSYDSFEECQDNDLVDDPVAVKGANALLDLACGWKRNYKQMNGKEEEEETRMKSEIGSSSEFYESSDTENKFYDETITIKRNKIDDRLPLKLPFKKDKRKWGMTITS